MFDGFLKTKHAILHNPTIAFLSPYTAPQNEVLCIYKCLYPNDYGSMFHNSLKLKRTQVSFNG